MYAKFFSFFLDAFRDKKNTRVAIWQVVFFLSLNASRKKKEKFGIHVSCHHSAKLALIFKWIL